MLVKLKKEKESQENKPLLLAATSRPVDSFQGLSCLFSDDVPVSDLPLFQLLVDVGWQPVRGLGAVVGGRGTPPSSGSGSVETHGGVAGGQLGCVVAMSTVSMVMIVMVL